MARFSRSRIGSDSGYYIRDTVGGAQFWQFYNEIGGHSWCGPPLCREWNDGTAYRQLFANCQFVQPIDGEPRLDAIVDGIVQGPPVSQDFDNAQKLVFAGWPRWDAGGGAVQPECQEYLNSNPAFTTGPSRSGVGTVGTKRRNLFANCAVECDLANGSRKLGTMGQFYKDFFLGNPNILPAECGVPEQFELTDTSVGLADDLPGVKKGADPCLGCAQGSDEGIAGIQHMNDLGCSFSRELFLWNGMDGGWDPSHLSKIATDRNFRTTKEIIGLFQFTPSYAGGASSGNGRFNVPNGLEHAPWDPRNTWGQAWHGVVGSRVPSAQEYASFPTAFLILANQTIPYQSPPFDWQGVTQIPRDAALNPVNRWIIGNEWDICQEDMPGFSFGGTRDDAYRMCTVAYQAAKAANPNCELLFPAVSLVDTRCDNSGGTEFFENYLDWLGTQPPDEVVANNGYFDHVPFIVHKEPERIGEFARKYRKLLDEFESRTGVPDPMKGKRKIYLIETQLFDDPGFGATFSENAAANFIIQASVNALVGGANELTLFKLQDFPMNSAQGVGARTAFRFFSHVNPQDGRNKKSPNVFGQDVAHNTETVVRCDLYGDGFRSTCLYNRNRVATPVTITCDQIDESIVTNPSERFFYVSDHCGNERRLAPGESWETTLNPPETTFDAFGKNWAWVGGDSLIIRSPSFHYGPMVDPSVTDLPGTFPGASGEIVIHGQDFNEFQDL